MFFFLWLHRYEPSLNHETWGGGGGGGEENLSNGLITEKKLLEENCNETVRPV